MNKVVISLMRLLTPLQFGDSQSLMTFQELFKHQEAMILLDVKFKILLLLQTENENGVFDLPRDLKSLPDLNIIFRLCHILS